MIALLDTKHYLAAPNLMAGLLSLWNPELIMFLGALWVVAFVYAGKSSVTCSSIDIQIIEKNI
jgi:hypothetical protein